MTASPNTQTLAPALRAHLFAESAAHLAGMLRGLASRCESVDFSVSANCFDLDSRLQAWDAAECNALGLPRAYARQ